MSSEGIDGASRSDEPQDPITTLAEKVLKALEADPDAEDVKAIVMLHRGEEGGIAIAGYDDDAEAASDLYVYLKAIFNANGQQVILRDLDEVILPPGDPHAP